MSNTSNTTLRAEDKAKQVAEESPAERHYKKMLEFQKVHPYGVTLLARDNKHNRKLFPNGPFGTIDVEESECFKKDNGSVMCPHYNDQDEVQDPSKALETPIHILIASFRDRLCGRTLHNAFTHAENPKRLFIRVIDQNKPGSDLEDDQGCWERYCAVYNKNCNEYESQVRTVHVDSSMSQGPTWARSRLSAMIHWDYIHRDDEKNLDLKSVHQNDYCMQIDSHMDFSDNFDTGLVEMHHRTKNDYAVLSTYVTDIVANNQGERTVPNLCMVEFTSSIRNWGTKECKFLAKPKMTNAMWGAGLSFHRCHGELTVPVDPYLDGVFDGEEGSRGIRFFTHGYDVYAPDIVLVTHDYHTHQGNPIVHTWGRGQKHLIEDEDEKKPESAWKWFEDIEQDRSKLSVFGTPRVNMLLGIGSYHNSTEQEIKELDYIRNSRFGLGTKRTMEQVREFTGINLLEKKMESNKCGNNYWVPYEESPEYGVSEILVRGNVGELSTPKHISEKVASKKGEKHEGHMKIADKKVKLAKKKIRGNGLPHKEDGDIDMLQHDYHVHATPKPLGLPPQLRRAAQALKAEEEKFVAGAKRAKDKLQAKEQEILAAHSQDYKLMGGLLLALLVIVFKGFSRFKRRSMDPKKRS